MSVWPCLRSLVEHPCTSCGRQHQSETLCCCASGSVHCRLLPVSRLVAMSSFKLCPARYAELDQEEIQNAKTGRGVSRPEPFRGRCIACVESWINDGIQAVASAPLRLKGSTLFSTYNVLTMCIDHTANEVVCKLLRQGRISPFC